MNGYGRGGSKAAATTLCQKCLKRGHYSYECKSATQERPYASRPSRTQQMLNPKLAPKLTNAAPAESLPKKAITDKVLEKSPDGRRRKQSLDNLDSRRPRKRSRSRSVSSHSSDSDSVATISTRSSRSPSESQHARNSIDHERHTSRKPDADRPSYKSGREKRRRRAGSDSSSEAKHFEHPDPVRAERERNTRMRRGSKSPTERGRRRSRSDLSDTRRKRSSSMRAQDTNDRIEPRRKELSGEDRASSLRSDTYNDADREMKDAGLARLRSLSPYSKRLALSRDTNT